MTNLKAGDLVRLRTGGPLLAVVKVNDDEMVTVAAARKKRIQTLDVPAATLAKLGYGTDLDLENQLLRKVLAKVDLGVIVPILQEIDQQLQQRGVVYLDYERDGPNVADRSLFQQCLESWRLCDGRTAYNVLANP